MEEKQMMVFPVLPAEGSVAQQSNPGRILKGSSTSKSLLNP